MTRQNFSLLVFDWDGTLMDSTLAIARAIQASCRDLGLPVPNDEVASHVIGLGLMDALKLAAPTLDEADYDRISARYRYHYLCRDHELALFAGVRPMLEALKAQGYMLAVATGKTRQGLNRALDQVGIGHLFDATRCADESFSKPNPAMLHDLTRYLGQEMLQTLMIGDTTHDLQMAANAGAQAVGVAYGAHPLSHLQAHRPLYVAQSVVELQRWFEQHL